MILFQPYKKMVGIKILQLVLNKFFVILMVVEYQFIITRVKHINQNY